MTKEEMAAVYAEDQMIGVSFFEKLVEKYDMDEETRAYLKREIANVFLSGHSAALNPEASKDFEELKKIISEIDAKIKLRRL